jgi:tRNA-Thr(GGU) m(6)t(6)A37 methyltransferase TsaA
MNQLQNDEPSSDSPDIRLRPVGFIRNQSQDPSWGKKLGRLDWHDRAARMSEQRESVSELVIDAGLEGILDGIDDFSHIMVIYWAHLVRPERRRTTRVHPMGNTDFPLVGVFATHSPVRPNSILTTVVRLLERQQNILKVTGLDALNGSPILDIKPYVPYREAKEPVRLPDWMKQVNEEFD